MLNKVQTYINRHRLLSEGDIVVVALSGGADSVVLLNVLLSLGYKCEAAHCNFHLRGEESDRDMHFVEKLCNELNVKLYIKHFDTLAYSTEQGISIEMAARELRYTWFDTFDCNAIAVAHHINDQAETLLLNLSRGCGLKGLGGMRPKNGRIIRPMLCVTRKEIEEFTEKQNISYVTDSTNNDIAIRRNAYRKLLAKATETELRHFADTAALMQQYYTLLGNIIRDEKIAASEENTLLYELLAPFGFNASQTDDILHSLSISGRKFVAPHYVATTDHGKLEITERKENDNEHKPTIHIIQRICNGKEEYPPANSLTAFFDADKLPAELTLRHWKDGDAFYPLSKNKHSGKKKLQDLFSDLKISLTVKKNIWLLCNAKQPNEIIWVVGYRHDDRFKVTSNTKTIAVVTLQ